MGALWETTHLPRDLHVVLFVGFVRPYVFPSGVVIYYPKRSCRGDYPPTNYPPVKGFDPAAVGDALEARGNAVD